MAKQSDVKKAIAGKNKMVIRYDDDPEDRVVYPHAIYKNSQDHIIVDAYQASGYSSTTKFPEWKMFFMKKIKSINISEDTFTIVSSYNPKSKRYVNAVAKVK